MIRKVTLLAVGALMGATAVSAINSYGGSANAAGTDLSSARDFRQCLRARPRPIRHPAGRKKLIESAIDGMLTSLDPHSSYLNQEAADDMRTQTRGEFGGLGIEVTMEDELVKVITPIDETPAARAGVLAGDFISEIDGEPVRGLSLGEAVDKMRGPVNTAIELTDPARRCRQADQDQGRARHHRRQGRALPGRGRCRLSAGDLVHREDL
jgi:carboxyl-terminal processing protease